MCPELFSGLNEVLGAGEPQYPAVLVALLGVDPTGVACAPWTGRSALGLSPLTKAPAVMAPGARCGAAGCPAQGLCCGSKGGDICAQLGLFGRISISRGEASGGGHCSAVFKAK